MSVTRLLLRLVLGRRLPVAAGELRLGGPRGPITIRRDGHGIPHVEAENDHDALFAIGFCQGQDRAAQLELLCRVGRGQLAEWVGPAGIGADRMSRRIGFHRAAEKQLAIISDFTRGQFEAFAAGITAGNSAGLTRKPHEFAILGGEPSAWHAADGLAVLKFQSFHLPSNWDAEIARLKILLGDGPEALLALDPSAGERLKECTSDTVDGAARVLDELAADLGHLQKYLPRGGGSNNWVISGSRTQSGKPLLASDPHLAPTAPAPWYLMHVRTPEWEAAGGFLVGSPGFAIGHNGFCAWGVTAGLTDNCDLFVETVGPDGQSVREAGGSYTPCVTAREVIRVKGGPDVIEEVLITPRGPVVSPLFPGIPAALSMSAVWLDPLPVNGFLGLPKARSLADLREPFAQWPYLPLNVLYADTTGKTGYQLIGQLPRRKGGHGLIPRAADRPEAGWDGYIPYDQMPFLEDPEPGFHATANNPPAKEAVKHEIWLGADYCDDYRARAILEALGPDRKWTLEDCLALQCDVRSIPWEEIREMVLGLSAADADACLGLELLRAWDGRVDADSPAATVFELFLAEMCVRAAQARAPREWRAVLGEFGLGGSGHNLFTDRRIAHIVGLIRSHPAGWFASWPAEMAGALATVVRKLRREVGPGPAFWGWGHLRQLRLDHLLLGKNRWLAPAFNLGPVPCGGDCNTISQAGTRPAEPIALTHNMANMRTVFDLADLAKSRFVLCGGQSGNPYSDHHADLLPLWQVGESITIAWDQAEVIRVAKSTLRLLPR